MTSKRDVLRICFFGPMTVLSFRARADDDKCTCPGNCCPQQKIVVGFPAGGATDVLARILAKALQEREKTTMIVENKPGASGALAAEYVAKAKPDTTTVLLGTSATQLAP